MGTSTIPFVETSVEEIPVITNRLRDTFYSQKTRPLSYRIKALRKIYWAIEDHKKELLAALQADLGKGYMSSMVEEITWVQNDCIFMANNLAKWAKDEKPADIEFPNSLMSPRLRKDPLGVVLVIGAFNFPVQLSFGPMFGAIAAGCTVVLKPSEGSPQSAMVMEKIMAASLDPDTYTTVQGGLAQSKALLEQKWDKIFFTGSPKTGSIIAQKAAETLTPCALELGGRNPAFITRKANVALAARRLLWAKTMNAGQVCISQNYILADRTIVDQLVIELRKVMTQFFPNGAKDSPDYGKITNKGAFNRLKGMLDQTSGKIVIGGGMDEASLFIEPTVVLVDNVNDSLIRDESFGPLIPILAFDNLDQAIHTANKVHSTPLALMAFGDKAETSKILTGTRSGGASINDGFYHGVIPTLDFGGVGDSGNVAYRGKASFDCFTHSRAVTNTPTWMESLLKVRYPPFHGTKKYKDFARFGVKKPNFDREGNTKLGLFGWIFSLGGLLSRGGSSVPRQALLVALVAVASVLMDRRGLINLPRWVR